MAIPDNIQKLLQPDADPKKKLMIAKGVFPMPPNVQIEALGMLLEDTDLDIRKNAQKTIMEMPSPILGNIIDKIENSKTIHIISVSKPNDDTILEKVLLSKYCSLQTVEKLASSASEKICTMIMNNQVRLLKEPRIAEAVRNNANALQSDIEKMLSFLKLNGIEMQGEAAELTLEEIEQILAMPDDDIAEELTKETDEPPTEEEKLSLYQAVQKLNVAQKIKVALKGNKEARSLLIKDKNKLVACAVIKNPRITDREILNTALNKSAQEEILRLICLNSQWTRHYSLQNALANNPKTPLQNALRFMRMLNINDVRKLSKNKNAHSQIQKMAKVLYMQKGR
ncbi:MAG: hypothetical protein KDK51_05150 [Deltaproteobacteria bacterium]|nr:hypothetical protein [Deltaproteobacteria bacterium]